MFDVNRDAAGGSSKLNTHAAPRSARRQMQSIEAAHHSRLSRMQSTGCRDCAVGVD